MPTVVISSESHKAIKEYLVDIDGYDIGEFIEDAVFFAVDHLEEFEDYADIGEEEEGESEEDTEKEGESEE